MENSEIKKVLTTDSLRDAEVITGKSYKEDKTTESIGFMLHMENSQKKREMLESLGDTTFSNELHHYLGILGGFGFEVVLKEPFINEDKITEHLFVLWHDEYSILLTFDTHTWSNSDGSFTKNGGTVPPPSVNGGDFYYNIKFNADVKRHDFTSSGGMRDNDIWVGNHDCREAVKFHISQMADNGTFQKQWVERPFLWLLHYMDRKVEGYDSDKNNAERIAKLPQRVIDAITPKK